MISISNRIVKKIGRRFDESSTSSKQLDCLPADLSPANVCRVKWVTISLERALGHDQDDERNRPQSRTVTVWCAFPKGIGWWAPFFAAHLSISRRDGAPGC